MNFFKFWNTAPRKLPLLAPTVAEIIDLLNLWVDPWTQQPMHKWHRLKLVEIKNKTLYIHIELPYAAISQHAMLKDNIIQYLQQYCSAWKIHISFTTYIAPKVSHQIKELKNIKHIIAISSAKGGVGKSTIALNTALALIHEGATVGILDADIYGPSLPLLTNCHTPGGMTADNLFLPAQKFNLKMMSIGFLVQDNAAIIWRGPMISQALQKMLIQTQWGELDYLIIDMPPGTGDIHISLSQKLQITGAVIVTTPQNMSKQDTQRGIAMFERINIPILGVISNMECYSCPHCQQTSPLFLTNHTTQVNYPSIDAASWHSKMPFSPELLNLSDNGAPLVFSTPHHPIAHNFYEIARKISISTLQLKLPHFPKIQIKKISEHSIS